MLTHVTNTLRAIERGAPVDLVFQSIAGTEAANRSFGIDLALLAEARAAALALQRGALFDDADGAQRGDNVMYFETGQGSALSASAHHGCDQQTIEARAYAVARHFEPLLVNTVVGFIGPEYLYDGKQIIRAGLEDHFCGKLLGLPMGCDICYTNHAEADQNDMDVLLTLLGVAGCSFIMGVPGSRRHDAELPDAPRSTTRCMRAACSACGRRPSSKPGCERMAIFDAGGATRWRLHPTRPAAGVRSARSAPCSATAMSDATDARHRLAAAAGSR